MVEIMLYAINNCVDLRLGLFFSIFRVFVIMHRDVDVVIVVEARSGNDVDYAAKCTVRLIERVGVHDHIISGCSCGGGAGKQKRAARDKGKNLSHLVRSFCAAGLLQCEKGRLDRVTRMAHKLRVVRVGPADGPTISRDHRAGLLGSGPVRLTNQSEIVRSYVSGVERLAKTGHLQFKTCHLVANDPKTGHHLLIKCAIDSVTLE